MSDAQVSIQTEADALKDILQWSETRPVWQSDALRRLIVHGELTDENINELTALCKDNSLASESLAQEHLGGQTTAAPTVALKKLSGTENVNALAEGQSLTFIPKGVTIIYGDNGAGKSGYVRILKSACRARTVRASKSKFFQTSMKANLVYKRLSLSITRVLKSKKRSGKTVNHPMIYYQRSVYSTPAQQACM